MRKIIAISLVIIALGGLSQTAQAKGDDFGAVVKLIEQFYHVKHKGIPFLARAGIKTTTTVARIAGGQRRALAEAGSVKVAYFEDQDFDSKGAFLRFRTSMGTMLGQSWSALMQVASPKDEEQTYIYLREAGDKFNVLVITIASRDACVVQVDLRPQSLAKLMQNPDEMGKTITNEATTEDRDN
jgi:hypothetical protein